MEDIKHKIKAVIFDMDGTIIKTEHIWKKVTVDVLKHQGVETLSDQDHAFLDSLAGMSLKKAAHELKEKFNLPDSAEDIFGLKLTLANTYFHKQLEFIHGFEQFHTKLQQFMIPSGLATNAHPDHLKTIVETMNFKRLFGENIYSIEHVQKPKPDPDLFLHTAAMLGAKPEECIVFEDSIHGFKAAQAAGMKCIALKNSNNKNLLDLVQDAIESYDQAEDALRKI